jgi:2'-5' RNA ligase
MAEGAEKKALTRVFICVEFPDEVIKEIARVQEVLENQKFHGKMTELENLHLTLKFLGEIDGKKIEKVKEKLKKIELKAFEAHLGEIGTFSFKENPKIVWCKICGKEVWELQEAVDNSLAGIFLKEERFMSHLTIARIRYAEDKKGFIEYVKKMKCKEIKFKVDRFFLKKSELMPSGPIYTTIEEYKLKLQCCINN